jgi:hypothetical protein
MKGCSAYAIDMVSCGNVYIPSFMSIGTSVQAILIFGLINLNGCNVGIAEGKEI